MYEQGNGVIEMTTSPANAGLVLVRFLWRSQDYEHIAIRLCSAFGLLLGPSFIPSEIFSELDVLSHRSVSLRQMPVVGHR